MIKNDKKYIIDIVPLTRIPLTRNQSFWYLNDKKLSPGTLVSIPLFRRKVEGIVLGSKDDFKRHGGIELKKVEKVIEESFLTDAQIKLAQFISDHYISPLGIVLKGFVPKRTKVRKIKIENTIAEPSSALRASSPVNGRGGIVLTDEQEKAVDMISGSRKLKIKNFLLFGPSGSGKTEIYIHSMLKMREKDPVKFGETPNHGAGKNAQFLVLVPEQTLTPQAIERYGQYFRPEEIAVLSSNITRGQFYENWQRVKSGEVKIIIATRIGVMAPFNNLRLVVIDEEQDMSYKQWDMNPRYDARRVAEKLAEIHKCPLIRGSATPSIESYYRSINKDLQLIKIPALNKAVTNTVIVDTKKERWQKNFSPISKKLRSEITYILKYKLQAVIFINRQGMSSFSVCENCKEVLKCPNCDRALISVSSGFYKCAHCTYKTDIFPQCPKCSGLSFKNIGLGTQKVEKEIYNFFPGAKVLRLDSETIKTRGSQEKVYQEFSRGDADILVGTQMISKGWDLPRVALVGIIDTDNMLSIPDFNTGEKAYQMIVQVSGRTSRPGTKYPGSVVIQTFQPENKIIIFAADRNFEDFYLSEIKDREQFFLPPFGKIIKLVFQDFDREKADKIAGEIYSIIKKNAPNVFITQAQDSYVPKVRGRYRKQLIVKLGSQKRTEKLAKILRSLPSGWIIDVDPISLI